MNEPGVKPGRNESCPCGSGRKYKHCCGLARGAPARPAPSPNDIGMLVAMVNRERVIEAEEACRKLLRMYPEAGMLWKILGVSLMRQGKDALQALRKTTALMPEDAEAHRNLAAALRDLGEPALGLESFRRALALAPHDVDCLLDTADAMRSLGYAREAVPLYQQALKIDPRRVAAQNDLGNAFLELALYPEAADCYRAALQLTPHNAEILCNLGNVLRELGRRLEALPLYTRAVELDPRRVDSHWNLGTVQFELRKSAEAMASFAQALALNPRHAPSHLSMGLALRQQRRPEDAEASCRAALAIEPDYVEALAFLGELLADRGRFPEAEELFQRALILNPEFSFAYFSIATHRRMTRDDRAWLSGAEALLDKQLPLNHEISLRYALGKYFDDVGQYDDAFENYRRANELTKRYGSTYDREKLTLRVDQIIGSFDRPPVHRSTAPVSASELPVFIVGMPRSGTSLTEQILASHPEVFGAGELPFWDIAYSAYRKAELAGEIPTDLVPGMAADYLERLAALHGGKRRVVDKMPANFLHAGLIHRAFPRARIIHMQRHPIDTCLSIYFQNFFSMGPYANDLDNLAHYYREYVRVTNHWRAVLPATALLEIPYEALVEDQEGWTRRILDFVGLPWDARCLEFHRTDRVVITASKWQVRQKINSSSAGRWRHYESFVGPLRHLVNHSPP